MTPFFDKDLTHFDRQDDETKDDAMLFAEGSLPHFV